MRYAFTRTGTFALSIGTLVLVSVLFATSSRFSPHESLDYSWIRFEDTTWRDHPSRIVNKLPGFCVVDNACYNQKTFYLTGGLEGDLREDAFTSRPTRLSPLPAEPGRNVRYLSGSTIWINENAEAGWTVLYWYYHFMIENVLGGLAALLAARKSTGHEADTELGTRLIIPWQRKWKDARGLNWAIIDGLFDGGFVDDRTWRSWSKDEHSWICFERLAMVDRWASHRNNPKAEIWNKMSIDMFETPAIVEDPEAFVKFWASLRNRTLRYQRIELDEKVGTEGHVPVVGYVDRQRTRRRLSLEAHQGVMQMFEALHAEGKVVFNHLHFEDFTPQQQLAQVAPVDILPVNHYTRDYQLVAALLGHTYIVLKNDTIVSEETWRTEPSQLPRGAENGQGEDNIPLDVDLVDAVLRSLLP